MGITKMKTIYFKIKLKISNVNHEEGENCNLSDFNSRLKTVKRNFLGLHRKNFPKLIRFRLRLLVQMAQQLFQAQLMLLVALVIFLIIWVKEVKIREVKPVPVIMSLSQLISGNNNFIISKSFSRRDLINLSRNKDN